MKYNIIIFLIILVNQLPFHAKAESVFWNKSKPQIQNKSGLKNLQIIEEHYNKIYRIYKSRIAYILDHCNGKTSVIGCGLIVNRKGLVCTFFSLINNSKKISVLIDNQEYNASLYRKDLKSDIALIKITKGKRSFMPVYIGNSDELKPGSRVLVMGSSYRQINYLSAGIVSSSSRTFLGRGGYIQTDALLSLGTMGGPLINLKGEVVGMNKMIFRKGRGSGIGFSLNINYIKNIVTELISKGKIIRGSIGIAILKMTDEFAKEAGLKTNRGLLVGMTYKNSPAQRAGLKSGDIILKINNKEMIDYKDLVDIIQKTPINKTVSLIVWRGGKKIKIEVKVEEKKVK